MVRHLQKIPCLGLTMGDPQGVGPELVVRTLARWQGDDFLPLGLGDPGILELAAERFAPEFEIKTITPDEIPEEPLRGVLYCLPLSALGADALNANPPGVKFGREVHHYLCEGITLALEGVIDGLVTAPIAKSALHAAGIGAPGHTEILAERSGVGKRFAMMLAGPKLRVSLATVHIPLTRVREELTAAQIEQVAELTFEWLVRHFGIPQPRIAVAGLNPHAGEKGMLGAEEEDLIAPAVARLRQQGIPVEGPFSPDTVFHRAYEGEFDAVIAMYHDQGLIPLKLVHFYEGVNLTLGLPFVRTSPDHGTAFDVAWKGTASTASYEAALRLALGLVARKAAGEVA